MKHHRLFSAAIFLLGVILRCLFISSRGINYDDAFSILLAQRSFGEIISGTAADTMPPLYYLVLHIWMSIFQSVWWYRLLSILLSLVGLIVLFLIVRMISDENAANWAIFIAAISPFQIYHAQDIRMYALLQLVQALYLYCFLLWMKESRRKLLYWIGMVFFGTAAFYTHNLGSIFLLVPNLYLVIKREWKALAGLAGAQIVMLVSFMPWGFYLPDQLEKIQTAFWTPKPGLLEIFQAFVTFTGSLTLPQPFLLPVAVLSSAFFILMILLFIRSKFVLAERKLLFSLALFWLPAILFVVSYWMRPVFVPRAFITSSLFFYGLSGITIEKMQPWPMKSVPVFLVVIAALISLPNLYLFDRFPRSPFEDAIAFLQSSVKPDEIIIHDNKLSYFPGVIYYPNLNQAFIADIPGSSNDTLAFATQEALEIFPAHSIESAAEDYEVVDFVVFTRTLMELEDLGLPVHPALSWLEKNMTLFEAVRFRDLEIYRFTR